jgi:uncharacterized iron-regulated membrane protein
MKIRWPLFVRRLHKWLALIIGLQVVLWTATGFYMVVVHIDTIHGDHLVKPVPQRTLELATLVPPERALRHYPDATNMRSSVVLNRTVWELSGPSGSKLVDGTTGQLLPAISRDQATSIARGIYAFNDPVRSVQLLHKAPMEMQSRKPPYWQVEFDRWNSPTLYISRDTGALVARRHSLWRIFDFAWMLHIMDYDERNDMNNLLLRVSTWLAVIMALTGAWLLVWAFPKKRKNKNKKKRT